ncbi:hypothetical protein Cni_G03350 [Canna indica]|uniref:Syntaxin 6/10/61 N-terminal domain-containing protein n=1 Tax=Canna indica TaxID=4628 RepID=A0AAQ3Q2Z6_9LILI|nr:hypothetical protein Cni_G03350 [Canna indica]
MAESFKRWESDPLFSAAEVVQDSADRMETVFRILLNEQKSMQGASPDSKLLSSIKYHNRDLVTCLETVRWQLEDFEREVSLASLSDMSNSRENAISKFRQFIKAVREQISQVEGNLDDYSMDDFNKNSPSVNLNEPDTDGLALFLSGGDSGDYHSHNDSGSSIMKRFLSSTTGGDEIVEIKNEEIFPLNGLKYSDHGYDKFGPHYLRRDTELPARLQDSSGEKECQGHSAFGASNMKLDDFQEYGYQNIRPRESFWIFLKNLWLTNKSQMSFTKRRKGGEVADDFIEDSGRRIPYSAIGILPTEQVSKHGQLINSLRFHALIGSTWRILKRSLYLIIYNQRVRLSSAILIALAILGQFMHLSIVPKLLVWPDI